MTSSTLLAHPELPEPTPSDTVLLRSYLIALKAGLSTKRGVRSERTREIYMGAIRLLARWAANQDKPLDEMTRRDIELYVVWMREVARQRNGKPYAEGYINNQYRSIQPFFNWLANEEEIPNPMAGLVPPKVSEKLVPIITDEQCEALLATAKNGKDHDARRDYAILRVFLSSGIRLAELTNLAVTDIDLENNCATVTGKGDRQRTIKFDRVTAQALDRYIRTRAKTHKMAKLPELWLGSNQRTPLLPNGVRQMVRRRAARCGFRLHPHMFRHTFSHRWLDAGGAEGDLMELNGWKSPAMLRRYGASARSARAQRAYDRVDVMGGR